MDLPSRVRFVTKPATTTNSKAITTVPSALDEPNRIRTVANSTGDTGPTKPESGPAQPLNFRQLGIDSWLNEALAAMAIHYPTEIQRECIPPTLTGKDIIGGAKTGSGKTAAFALPILQKLSEEPFGVFALVLTPTRELAFQIAEQFRALGSHIHARVATIVGGADIARQTGVLAGHPHIVIATPGRLADLIRSAPDVAHLDHIRFLVLDEADRLLGPSFTDDLKLIFSIVPKRRQTLLYTATISDEILALRDRQPDPAKRPSIHLCQDATATVVGLLQNYTLVPSQVRVVYLFYLLRQEELGSSSTIIFVNRCATCEMLRLMLRQLKVPCTALHSHMTLNERRNSVSRFRSRETPILICTDVASRGLDIPSVRLVLNYELPMNPTDYIHRVGRTARAGTMGTALSLVTERDVALLKKIEERTASPMFELKVPETKALEFLSHVNKAKRFALATMSLKKFGEKKRLYKQKALAMQAK
ncbi:putative RNA helicase [Tieghemiomyces parasiticus]|uniref:RNA helicase n=1 Tax=Tieghemiomyces parasiticus TaxID=78921 RepID=A0A9W7ZTB5_9FUNG|nr:putative RNA helicase [Tieghemiomyces parasiticus]